MVRGAKQQPFNSKWVLLVPVALAVFAIGVGIDNLRPGTNENTLRDMLGSHLAAGITGGFFPAALLIASLAWSWHAPAVRVAVTLAILFLYLGGLQTWMGLRGGWVNQSMLSLLGVAGALVYLAALTASRRQPLVSGPLAMAGAVAMTVIGWWTFVLPVIALMLGIFGLRRAQQFAGESHALS